MASERVTCSYCGRCGRRVPPEVFLDPKPRCPSCELELPRQQAHVRRERRRELIPDLPDHSKGRRHRGRPDLAGSASRRREPESEGQPLLVVGAVLLLAIGILIGVYISISGPSDDDAVASSGGPATPGDAGSDSQAGSEREKDLPAAASESRPGTTPPAESQPQDPPPTTEPSQPEPGPAGSAAEEEEELPPLGSGDGMPTIGGGVLGSDDSGTKEEDSDGGTEGSGSKPDAGANDDGTTEPPLADKDQAPYVASKTSKKYHRRDCRYAKRISKHNLVRFQTPEEAQQKGFEPAACVD